MTWLVAGFAITSSPIMEAAAPAIIRMAMGTAVCSPPRPAMGAMVPAATHWTKPRTAEPVPGWSGTAAEARAPPLGPMRPWALIMMKKQTMATNSGVSNHRAPINIPIPAATAASCPARMTLRVGMRPASRAATRAAMVIPPALAAKTIEYAIGDNPYGPFTYRGVILTPVVGWTTHHSILEFKGKWWMFYHDSTLSEGKTHLRSVKVRELAYNPDGSIVTMEGLD